MATTLALYLTSTTDPGIREGERFLHITAQPVTLVDGRVRNILDSDWDRARLADLTITSQYERGEEPRSYGWQVRYSNSYSVDLERAEVMVKQLRSVRRKLAQLEERYGFPSDFAQYLMRVADALGITEFVVVARDPGAATSRGFSGLHDDNLHRTLTPLSAAYWIAEREREFCHPPQARSTA
jgi:hypothetical protein